MVELEAVVKETEAVGWEAVTASEADRKSNRGSGTTCIASWIGKECTISCSQRVAHRLRRCHDRSDKPVVLQVAQVD